LVTTEGTEKHRGFARGPLKTSFMFKVQGSKS
jgi:hypothetical protein